jgi:hypothetical protein
MPSVSAAFDGVTNCSTGRWTLGGARCEIRTSPPCERRPRWRRGSGATPADRPRPSRRRGRVAGPTPAACEDAGQRRGFLGGRPPHPYDRAPLWRPRIRPKRAGHPGARRANPRARGALYGDVSEGSSLGTRPLGAPGFASRRLRPLLLLSPDSDFVRALRGSSRGARRGSTLRGRSPASSPRGAQRQRGWLRRRCVARAAPRLNPGGCHEPDPPSAPAAPTGVERRWLWRGWSPRANLSRA